MPFLSHGVLVADRTVPLSPFTTFREAGTACESPKSAVRVLQILEFATERPEAFRAVDITAALGLSPSSTSELLKAMVDRAYLIFDPVTKRYAPSPRLSRMTDALDAGYFGRGAIARVMQGLAGAFRGVVVLSAPQGTFMQVLDVLPTTEPPERRAFGAFQDIGFRVSLFGTSTGAAWLLKQSDERIRTMMRLCRRELGNTPVDQQALIAHIRELSAQGYAYGGISKEDDHRALAVPLPPARDGVVLVLSMYGERTEMEERREALAQLALELMDRELAPPAGTLPR
jgi:IclR family KDG regulon transcriptional repressor